MGRDLSDTEMENLLEEELYCHLGCVSEGEVYVVPATYAYTDGTIVSYTHEGKKLAMLRSNPSACFQVEHLGEKEWRSVICWGVFEEVKDREDIRSVARSLAEKYASARASKKPVYSPLMKDIGEWKDVHGKVPVFFRIRIRKRTGRSESFV